MHPQQAEAESTSNYQTMEIPKHQNGFDDHNDGIMIDSSTGGNESHTRSILKGITWRAVATGTTIMISWLVIGEVAVAFQIGFFEVFAKIAIYYVHERIWAKVPV
jgi:uncharacterized membrane protein